MKCLQNERNKKLSFQFGIVCLSFHDLYLQILRATVLNFEMVQNDVWFFDQDIEKSNFSKEHLCKTKLKLIKLFFSKCMDLFRLKIYQVVYENRYIVESFCQLLLISSDYKMFQSSSLGILPGRLPETHSLISSSRIEAFTFFKN